ncbi:zinc finger MYND domain-containing protein 10-like [Styela clava]
MTDGSGESSYVLLSVEAEALIEGFQLFPIKELGGPRWQKQHEYVEKLNMQALLNASEEKEEYIKESLVNLDKVSKLIEDVITTEVWKKQIFEVILKTDFKPPTTIPMYVVLYHEATLVTLLETVLYHKEALESAEDTVLDLLDYCYRKLTKAIAEKQKSEQAEETEGEANSMEEMKQQNKKMEFEIAVKCMSILRYITDCLDCVPLSTRSRVLEVHNIPCLLVELVENSPWTKNGSSGVMKFIDGKWTPVSGPDIMQLTKTEGQVWLAIYNLLMNRESALKYDFNSYNKTQILKLRGFMNDVLLDQLPILAQFRQYLEQLSMTDPPPPKRELILEQVPEIMDRIMKENEGKWKAIAKYQMKNFFNPSKSEIQAQAKRLADTYNFDVMDSLLSEVPKCSNCGEEATKRCSRCRQEWYCKRECQVKHWPKHKKVCDVMMNAK